MAFIICFKNFDDQQGSLVKIAADQTELDTLNISKDSLKIINILEIDFNNLNNGIKIFVSYSGDTVTYIDKSENFTSVENVNFYVNDITKKINFFLENNPNHSSFNTWKNYKNQIDNFNFDSLEYPMNNTSFEQILLNNGITPIHILRLP
jgi:hypothetical protein